MVKEILEILILNNLKITFAESCTGGAVVAKLVENEGASNVLDCSFVTYSNESKEEILGVKKETIEQYGVVSENVAYEMCVNAAKKANSDIAISTTGIAGPSKDMGKVCFGYYVKGHTVTKTIQIDVKKRTDVIDYAVVEAYNTLSLLIKRFL